MCSGKSQAISLKIDPDLGRPQAISLKIDPDLGRSQAISLKIDPYLGRPHAISHSTSLAINLWWGLRHTSLYRPTAVILIKLLGLFRGQF